MKHYTVTAIPHEGFEHFRRAGHRFGTEPTEVVVREADPANPHGPYEFTPEQFEQIKKERRLKVETSSGRPVNDAAKAEAEAEKAAEAAAAKPRR